MKERPGRRELEEKTARLSAAMRESCDVLAGALEQEWVAVAEAGRAGALTPARADVDEKRDKQSGGEMARFRQEVERAKARSASARQAAAAAIASATEWAEELQSWIRRDPGQTPRLRDVLLGRYRETVLRTEVEIREEAEFLGRLVDLLRSETRWWRVQLERHAPKGEERKQQKAVRPSRLPLSPVLPMAMGDLPVVAGPGSGAIGELPAGATRSPGSARAAIGCTLCGDTASGVMGAFPHPQRRVDWIGKEASSHEFARSPLPRTR